MGGEINNVLETSLDLSINFIYMQNQEKLKKKTKKKQSSS